MTYPALGLLLQAYLNWDWPDDYADLWAAVDEFIALEPIALQIPDEVQEAMRFATSEEALRHLVVQELGSGYLPDADGLTMKEWLRNLAERVQEALGG